MKKALLPFCIFVLLLSVSACSSKQTGKTEIEMKTKDENSQVQEMTSTIDMRSNQRKIENETAVTINKADAESLVREHLGLLDNDFLHVEVDHEEGNKYVVHVYEVVKHGELSHTATYGWYYVDKDSGKIEDMMEEN